MKFVMLIVMINIYNPFGLYILSKVKFHVTPRIIKIHIRKDPEKSRTKRVKE